MKKILVIDDNPGLRENLKEILQLSGYDAITAADGKEGIAKTVECMPDLILCDIVMPNLDGFGTLEILNRNRKTAGIPLIFLTAKSEHEEFRKGMALGAFDYITKPFDDVNLLQTIETRLRKVELLRQASEPHQGSIDQFLSEARGTEALTHLPDNCEVRRYRKNDVLFEEGASANWLFYIEKGRAKGYKTSDDGRDLITNIYTQGDFMGYLALLQDTPHTESASAMESLTVKLIPKSDFLSLVFGNHDVAVRFIKMLANHVSEREERLLHLAYHSVRRRLAEALLKYATVNEGQISMFRGDLASIVGAAKETLIRTLFEFKSEGWIDIDGQTITVKKPLKLQALPN